MRNSIALIYNITIITHHFVNEKHFQGKIDTVVGTTVIHSNMFTTDRF